ncbi:MAG: TIR domain-containing protein [Anaerolineales bacterium]|nr:TIR domain-containing protein [Anaerolineales bacterium]
MTYNLKNIRALLTQGFSDADLRRFCFDEPAFRPVHDDLAGLTGKTVIVDRLLEYAQQQELMDALLAWAKEQNPARYKSQGPYVGAAEKSTPKLEPSNQSTQRAASLEREIFVSYAWGGESEEIVNRLDQALQAKGVTIIRDKRDLGFKGRIKAFMEQIGRGKAVIVVISEKYLKSENCMFELVQIARNGQFYDRIFPIVLADAQIYKPVQRIKYIQHWEQQIKELDEAMKTVSAANLQGFREDIDQYTEIRNTMAELTNIIKDMNALTPEMHSESGFAELFKAIEGKLAE